MRVRPMAVAGLIVVVLDVSEASVGKPTLRDRGPDT
jgi:hypothetical protein